MELHSKNGTHFTLHLINHQNIEFYLDNIHPSFYNLCYAHQADYARVHLLYKYGGIYFDSDVLIMNNLNEVYNLLDTYEGFFIQTETVDKITNAVLCSRPQTKLYKLWCERIKQILDQSMDGKIGWTAIGTYILIDF